MQNIVRALPLLVVLTSCGWFENLSGMSGDANKALGAACRQSGRSLESCFQLHPQADKAALYAGWREMQEYMAKQNLSPMPPNDASDGDESNVNHSALSGSTINNVSSDPEVAAIVRSLRNNNPTVVNQNQDQDKLVNMINELNRNPGRNTTTPQARP